MQTKENKLEEVEAVSVDESLIWTKAKKGEYWGEGGAIAVAKSLLNTSEWADGNGKDFHTLSHVYYLAAMNAWAQWRVAPYNPMHLLRYGKAKSKAIRLSEKWTGKVYRHEATPMELYVRGQIMSLSGLHTQAISILLDAERIAKPRGDVKVLAILAMAEINYRLGDDYAFQNFKKAESLSRSAEPLVRVKVLGSYAKYLKRESINSDDKAAASNFLVEAMKIAKEKQLLDEYTKLLPAFKEIMPSL